MLSKSDFQLASSCPKKLVYKKLAYPTSNDTNEYMEMLAQGGYIIGYMATLLYPDGIDIKGSTTAVELTANYLRFENVTLFEAAVQSGDKVARIDILEKKGNSIHLIEVKAKSHDSDGDEGSENKGLKKYIEDVGFQYMVLSEAYPGYSIRCSLLMPDKSKRTNIDGLAGWFTIEPSSVDGTELDELPAQAKPRFKKPVIRFKYENDPNRQQYLDQLINDGILGARDITQVVLSLQPELKQKSKQFIRILQNGITEDDYSISKNCKSCEFNPKEGVTPNGYNECWSHMPRVKHHIFDLYSGGSIGHHTKGWYLDELISQGKCSLFDIERERLKNSNGEFSPRGIRQLIQLGCTESNTEWILEESLGMNNNFEYPLHFIDFETYTGAIPFHAGMRPYELIAFQWSCHTIKHHGASPEHHEWIHPHDNFPNFEFARSLMNLIGTNGTRFMWATHENTVLRTILDQMDLFNHHDPVLREWLKSMIGTFVDMNDLTKKYYFHPQMKGRTSIKKVLPAVWNNNSYLQQVEFFKDYVLVDFENNVLDPYDTLTAGIDFPDDDEVVKGGTAAMRAYQRIRFDSSLPLEKKEELRRQLIQYCRIDTLAMVIIAHHWGIK